ncbi:hypothetical protein BJX63DRAFT_433511 [Aspergillus granulosus]|uniref:Uncharacterized protein n=1 Tax=Aspergillus granulosus TaxID=176169 RepID=A0ABR4H996_9EURO
MSMLTNHSSLVRKSSMNWPTHGPAPPPWFFVGPVVQRRIKHSEVIRSDSHTLTPPTGTQQIRDCFPLIPEADWIVNIIEFQPLCEIPITALPVLEDHVTIRVEPTLLVESEIFPSSSRFQNHAAGFATHIRQQGSSDSSLLSVFVDVWSPCPGSALQIR